MANLVTLLVMYVVRVFKRYAFFFISFRWNLLCLKYKYLDILIKARNSQNHEHFQLLHKQSDPAQFEYKKDMNSTHTAAAYHHFQKQKRS